MNTDRKQLVEKLTGELFDEMLEEGIGNNSYNMDLCMVSLDIFKRRFDEYCKERDELDNMQWDSLF